MEVPLEALLGNRTAAGKAGEGGVSESFGWATCTEEELWRRVASHRSIRGALGILSPMTANKQSAGLAPAEAQGLAQLVDYADGSVVSRVLVKNAAGTVTLFAFAEGEELSEHTAPFDALVQLIDGEGEFVIGGKAVRLSAGQVVLMPGHVPHAVRATSRFKMVLTMLRAEAT